MRTLVFGAKGQLGRDLVIRFRQEGEVHGVDLPECDVASAAAVDAAVELFGPDLVINAAAYTDVERAEDDTSACFRVNEEGAARVAEAAVRVKAPIVYYSTDYVFDGAKLAPYESEDAPAPLSVYAQSKVAGEAATRRANPRHFVLRTAWLYGPGGNNFVEKILAAAAQRPELKVVEDEVGSPTYTWDLAEATAALVVGTDYGMYHVVNAGACSRFAFAQAIVRGAGLDTRVIPCAAGAFPMKARRPLYSALSSRKFEERTGRTMRSWQDALAAFLKRRRENA